MKNDWSQSGSYMEWCRVTQLVCGRAQDYALQTESLRPLPQSGLCLAWSLCTLHGLSLFQSHPWTVGVLRNTSRWGVNSPLPEVMWASYGTTDCRGERQRQSCGIAFHDVTPVTHVWQGQAPPRPQRTGARGSAAQTRRRTWCSVSPSGQWQCGWC